MTEQLITTNNWRVNVSENDKGELMVVVATTDGADVLALPKMTGELDATGTLSCFFGSETIEAAANAAIPEFMTVQYGNSLTVSYNVSNKPLQGKTADQAAAELVTHLVTVLAIKKLNPTRGVVRAILDDALVLLADRDRDRLRNLAIEMWIKRTGHGY